VALWSLKGTVTLTEKPPVFCYLPKWFKRQIPCYNPGDDFNEKASAVLFSNIEVIVSYLYGHIL